MWAGATLLLEQGSVEGTSAMHILTRRASLAAVLIALTCRRWPRVRPSSRSSEPGAGKAWRRWRIPRHREPRRPRQGGPGPDGAAPAARAPCNVLQPRSAFSGKAPQRAAQRRNGALAQPRSQPREQAVERSRTQTRVKQQAQERRQQLKQRQRPARSAETGGKAGRAGATAASRCRQASAAAAGRPAGRTRAGDRPAAPRASQSACSAAGTCSVSRAASSDRPADHRQPHPAPSPPAPLHACAPGAGADVCGLQLPRRRRHDLRCRSRYLRDRRRHPVLDRAGGPPAGASGSRLALSTQQMRCIYESVPKDQARVDLRIRLALGAEVPRDVKLASFPEGSLSCSRGLRTSATSWWRTTLSSSIPPTTRSCR